MHDGVTPGTWLDSIEASDETKKEYEKLCTHPDDELKTKEENKNTVNEYDESLLNAPSLLQTVTMTTNHNEKYVCELPKEEVKLKQSDEEYNVRLY